MTFADAPASDRTGPAPWLRRLVTEPRIKGRDRWRGRLSWKISTMIVPLNATLWNGFGVGLPLNLTSQKPLQAKLTIDDDTSSWIRKPFITSSPDGDRNPPVWSRRRIKPRCREI